jgi:hypothetical protein
MTRPKCFGVPSVFSFTSPVCAICTLKTDCQDVSYSALKGATQTLQISNLINMHERARSGFFSSNVAQVGASSENVSKGLKTRRSQQKKILSVAQEVTLSKAPKKVAKVARTLLEKGFEFQGANPFKPTNKTYFTAFERLKAGPATKKDIRMTLCSELSWGETSAYSEVSVIWSLFPILGIASQSEDGSTLSVIDVDCDSDYNGHDLSRTN